ncbi:unnamed protein product [Rhizophagus irregularis]|nr:unnamed protein product [Rhizophagus irregularis]
METTFAGDVLQYWIWCSEKTKELGFIAKKIFGIAVNATSVERLWSAMGFFYSVQRNCLHHKKVLLMAQICGVINQAYKNQELETIKNMYHSDSARNIDDEENNIDKDIENENQQDDGKNSNLDIIENNEHEMEHEDMLENNNNFGKKITMQNGS